MSQNSNVKDSISDIDIRGWKMNYINSVVFNYLCYIFNFCGTLITHLSGGRLVNHSSIAEIPACVVKI